jgi:hypothetical protein
MEKVIINCSDLCTINELLRLQYRIESITHSDITNTK